MPYGLLKVSQVEGEWVSTILYILRLPLSPSTISMFVRNYSSTGLAKPKIPS